MIEFKVPLEHVRGRLDDVAVAAGFGTPFQINGD
jgi:hypothetical protein